MKKYLETFTNEYGEKWWFNYDKENDMGIIESNDFLIKGEKYYVFDGECIDLILNKKEKEWLTNVWNKYSNKINDYLNKETEFIHINNGGYLTNNYCPICLKQRENFEGHHCIPSSEGGSDDSVNILYICNSCHALITNGCNEDSKTRFDCAIYHQISKFGIDFYKMNPFNNKRYKNINTQLYKIRPYIKEIIDWYDKLNKKDKEIANKKVKKICLYKYKYYRAIINGGII